jgi:hypothetical protein
MPTTIALKNGLQSPETEGFPFGVNLTSGKASCILNATYSIPVFRDARFYGIAVADISLPGSYRQIQTLEIHGGFIYIESKLNTIIAHPDQSLILSKSTKFENSKDLWVEKQAVEATGWNLVANVSEKAALRDVLKQLRLQLYLLIGSLASIIALITGVGFGITKPLRKLTRGQNAFLRVNLIFVFGYQYQGRIKDLAKTSAHGGKYQSKNEGDIISC